MRKSTHSQHILRRMLKGRRITSMDAIILYGCTRLSGRIYDLKEAGIPVKSQLRKGEDFKEYWIEKDELTQAQYKACLMVLNPDKFKQKEAEILG